MSAPDPQLVSGGGGLVRPLADLLGASEPALRLLISILMGYPLALIHRNFVYGKHPNVQHLFFISCGLLLGAFNYGFDIIHSVASILVVYLVLLFAGGTALSVGIVFVFCMTYLLIGYYVTGTQEYDIKWSMPQCVLTLRLIGLAFDVYDGQKDPAKLSADQKKTALRSCPSLLEVAAHTYFFGGFLVGPQFPMKRYKDFVKGEFSFPGKKPDCILPALARLALGFYFLITYQVGSMIVPERYLLTEEYAESAFWTKAFWMAFWGRIALHKYVACWLIAEGSCIMTGLTYNGKDEQGNDQWDGCANVKVYEFEVTTTFGGIIKSFNINTNLWVAQYVFKRLKFLGSKEASQALTLLFLAVWHGLHSGYYVCFFNEFIVMKMERELSNLLKNIPAVQNFLHPSSALLKVPLYAARKFYLLFFFGYCLTPFVLLSFHRWFKVYQAVYFAGHVVYLGWPLLHPFLRGALLDKKAAKVQ